MQEDEEAKIIAKCDEIRRSYSISLNRMFRITFETSHVESYENVAMMKM